MNFTALSNPPILNPSLPHRNPPIDRILTLGQKTLELYSRVSIFITSSSLDHF